MINSIRKPWLLRPLTLMVCASFLFQLAYPATSFALTSGPSTPEVQSFEPIGTTQMVDPFTGDFNYNVPLMDVGGYPINLHYHAGIGMEQEASWVGLGWNINPGVINRDVQGIPDDFDGDQIDYEFNKKRNTTVNLDLIHPSVEIFGFGLERILNGRQGLETGIHYNNYRGVGFEFGGKTIKTSTSEGINVNIGYTWRRDDGRKNRVSIGYNSREGLTQIGVQESYSAFDLQGYSFALKNYTPVSNPHISSLSASTGIKFSPELFGLFAGTGVSMGFTDYYIKEKDKQFSRAAYGYLNAQKADPESVMDKQNSTVSFNKFSKYIDPSIHTYDNFSISGQGIGGQFRPFRTQVGAISDHSYKTDNKFSVDGFGFTGKMDIGAGNVVKLGFDILPNIKLHKFGRWEECFECDNQTLERLNFIKPNTWLGEHFYFKSLGEITLADEDYFDQIKGTETVKLSLADLEFLPTMPPSYIYDKIMGDLPSGANAENIELASSVKRQKRERRKDMIQYLKHDERKEYGIEKDVYNYTTSRSTVTDDAYRRDHHLSEITTLGEDGSRYVYGIPAYGDKKEVSFAVGDKDTDPFDCGNNGLVNYSADDASLDGDGNEKGIDHFYQMTKTPKHAYAYHLNCILSPDYADLTGDGPTPDDFGTYTKFNYERLENLFEWRIPHVAASISRGLLSNTMDDRANYLCGEKEIWYLKSIETKTHIAIFETSEREDGLGSAEDQFDMNTPAFKTDKKLRKLDKIKLYTREQLDNSTDITILSGAVPVKTVYFKYSYDLCGNVPNNTGDTKGDHPLKDEGLFDPSDYDYDGDLNGNKGKLTLNKVYFTYGNSDEGKGSLSPYLFEYGENEDYKFKSSDRWGVYTDQDYNFRDGGCNPLASLEEFPYTEQGDQEKADKRAAMWCLHKIYMPSGGSMTINYESDDYAYVQDKPALQMTTILGMGGSDAGEYASSFNVSDNDNHDDQEFVYFDIDDDRSIDEYIYIENDKKYLYFKFLVHLKDGDTKSEYVEGYAEYDDYGEYLDGTDKKGWIKLKRKNGVPMTGKQFNPIKIAAFDFIRLHMPWLVHKGEDLMNSNESNKVKMVGLLFSGIKDISIMLQGIYRYMDGKFANEFDPTYCQIRLKNPEGKKFGGGHRVKSIIINDGWGYMMAGEFDHFYGQVYEYTTTEGSSIISSGVASYEPLIGGAEIPQRQPEFRKIAVPLGTDYWLYDDYPVCEDLYPGPVVGYSKTTVRSIKPAEAHEDYEGYNITRHGTGKTEYEFYTAKDFPTRSFATKLDKYLSSSLILGLFGLHIDKNIASQGFSIELNDMHGQPKAINEFNERGMLIAQTSYQFKSEGKNLVNTVQALNKDGTVTEGLAGVDIETVVEPLEREDIDITAGVEANLDFFLTGVIPTPVWSFIPVWDYRNEQVKTVTVTKIIQRYGILESVAVMKNGSTLTTRNIAWDAETGDVILTANETEYGKYNYGLTIPAHFAYEGMDGAYKNLHAIFSATVSSGQISIPVAEILSPGDELSVKDGSAFEEQAWVLDVDNTGLDATLIDRNGNRYPNGLYEFKVIRSGRRNMQSSPISNILMTENPISAGMFDTYAGSNSDKIISSSALEYAELKRVYPFYDFQYIKNCSDSTESHSVLRLYGELPSEANLHYISKKNASITGVSNPANRFLPCKYVGAGCSVNYVNPYALGILGTFYPFKALKYYDKDNPDRSVSINPLGVTPDFNQTKAGEDGLMAYYVPYWTLSATTYWSHISIDDNNNILTDDWTWTSIPQIVDQNGNEIQGLDALQINSAAQYGYNKKFAVAVADNAPHSSIVFEGFEEYSTSSLYACPEGYSYTIAASAQFNKYNKTNWHWMMWPNLTPGRASITTVDAHTGKNSIKLGHDAIEIPFSVPAEPTYPSPSALMPQYYLDRTNTIQGFYPNNLLSSGNFSYLLTYWGKYDPKVVNPYFQLQYYNGSSWVNIPCNELDEPRDPVDGWIRKTIEIVVPQAAKDQRMRMLVFKGLLDNTSIGYVTDPDIDELTAPGTDILLDDIRIMPKASNMKCFVYDNVFYRLMAELDENHYATLYEYDDQGRLVRTKKETVRGIKTVQETRQNISRRIE